MNFDDLSPEIREKALACQTPEELSALAKSVGYEMTDEELDAIAGGKWNSGCGQRCETYHDDSW